MVDINRPSLDPAGPSLNRSAESNAMAQLMIDSIRDYAVFMLDPAGKVLSWNIGATRIMGYTASDIIDSDFARFYPEEIRDTVPQRTLEAALRSGSNRTEGWQIRKDGSRFWASVVIEPVLGVAGHHIGFAEVTRDTTERRNAEQALRTANAELEQRVEERTRELHILNIELERLADTDPLTGIFNRRGFISVAAHEMRRSTRYKTPFSVLFVDVDDFKITNDTFGHAAGDGVLRMVVKEMGGQLRGGDVMARLGGDEFVLLLLETTSDRAVGVAERLHREVASNITTIEGQSFTTEVSVGVAQWAPDESIETLLARADAALYRAKAGDGGHKVAVANSAGQHTRIE